MYDATTNAILYRLDNANNRIKKLTTRLNELEDKLNKLDDQLPNKINNRYITENTFKVGKTYLITSDKTNGNILMFLEYKKDLLTFMGISDKWWFDISHGFNYNAVEVTKEDYPNEFEKINEQLIRYALANN